MISIDDVLKLADIAYITHHPAEIGQIDHIAYSSSIYSNGSYSVNVDTSTGYIIINDILDATYLIYLDKNKKITLFIYQGILHTELKHVQDAIHDIKQDLDIDELEINSKSTNNNNDLVDNIVINDINLNNVSFDQFHNDSDIRQQILRLDGLVDINNMQCEECNNKEFKPPILCNDNKTLEFKCEKCHTIYHLKPSKYYLLESKTLFIDNKDMNVNIKINNIKSALNNNLSSKETK